MTSALLKDYMEENLTTDRVLLLTSRNHSTLNVSDTYHHLSFNNLLIYLSIFHIMTAIIVFS